MPGGRSHHSIVSFYEIYEVDSQFQLVMEYVDGKNGTTGSPSSTRRCPSPAAQRSAGTYCRHSTSPTQRVTFIAT